MVGDKDYRDLKRLKVELDQFKNRLWWQIQREQNQDVKKALLDVYRKLQRVM